ncbi:MAG TPA: cytochrome c [Rudaea sp.]
MRYALLFVLGLALGGIGVGIANNALRLRDAYPRAVMQILQHEVGALRQNLRTQRCEAESTRRAIGRLAEFAGETENAVYGTQTPEAPFREYAARLREAVAVAAQTASGDCAALAPTVHAIGEACEACHRQYR